MNRLLKQTLLRDPKMRNACFLSVLLNYKCHFTLFRHIYIIWEESLPHNLNVFFLFFSTACLPIKFTFLTVVYSHLVKSFENPENVRRDSKNAVLTILPKTFSAKTPKNFC